MNNASSPMYPLLSTGASTSLAVCFVLIAIFSILFNAILITVILSEKKLHTMTNIYIINLAIGDLLTAIAVVPFDADYMFKQNFPYDKIPCGIKEILFMVSLPSSIINLLLLTCERFVSVYFPFEETRYFSKRIVFLSISLSWIYSMNVGFYPIYKDGISAIIIKDKRCYMEFSPAFAYYHIIVNFTIPVLIIAGLNIFLFTVAHKHQKEILKMVINNSQKCSFHGNVKAAKTILMLFGNFFVCWIIYILIATSHLSCHQDNCLPKELPWVSNVINYLSIVLNPFIYGLLNTCIRKAILKNIHKVLNLFCKSQQIKCIKETDLHLIAPS
ncbi:octopamine receptor beta-2R-like [Hydra vulgaris]|uniref:Octopamine receptor beta-2R-like n=1 Tax=Hydra vulgaris TaxID=6087 RepID=A0ABM4CPK6_HYDVU